MSFKIIENQKVLPKVFQVQVACLLIIIVYIWNPCYSVKSRAAPHRCGIDNTTSATVRAGEVNIEDYPWMGMLLHPFGDDMLEEPTTTTVVLITSHLALASAIDIDKYPKDEFRRRSRVILGHNCSTGPYNRVLQYAYHPDFATKVYSTLALLQIENTNTKQDLMPLCAPPKQFLDGEIYAMTITHDCSSSMLKLYKMTYVKQNHCREFYRRTNWDISNMWPQYVSCAQALEKGECLWKSGTALVIKQEGKWHLLGIGVYGPGCEAPARFHDYHNYIPWIRDSISRIGKVTITRINASSVILRRSSTTLARYGPCDIEETSNNFYTDYTEITPPGHVSSFGGVVNFNLTIFAKIDYSCIAIRTWYVDSLLRPGLLRPSFLTPRLKIRKYCFSKAPLCADASFSTIFFYVEIRYESQFFYKVSFYGTPIKTIEAKRVLWWTNQKKPFPAMAQWSFSWQVESEKFDAFPYPHPESNAYPMYPSRGL